tara:strand:+ start:2265 stop:4067 length:1803 start_codon:yes stop_codon:yes gene_type:complete
MANYPQEVKVKYGSFEFPVPTPFVSKSFENNYIGGNVFSTTVNVSLTGRIALLSKRDDNAGNDYLKLSQKRDTIAEAFAGALNKNYQDFSVIGHGTEFHLKNCTVEDISFSSSNYVGFVDYTISLIGYKSDKDFYTANYGVTDPVDSWAYTESDDGTVSVVHNISASGYNTNNDTPNGFIKAKAYVESRKGTSLKVNQALTRNAHPDSALILNSISETADRLAGSYSITENYSFVTNEASEAKGEESSLPSMQTANILLTYELSLDEQQGSDFIALTLSGQISGNKESGTTWEQIKSDFKSRSFFELVNKAYKRHVKGAGGTRPGGSTNLELNEEPVSFSISPNEEAKTLTFSIVYDNNKLFSNAKIKNASSYFDYNIGFEHDNITDIISVTCQGNILTRGALEKRNRDALTLLDLMLANNSKLVRDEAQSMYNTMFPTRTQYVLAPRPTSISVSRNEFDGTISYSASFSDKDFPENSSLRDLNYSVDIEPAMQIYSPVPSCLRNGHYLIYDMKLQTKRETVGVNTAAMADDRTESSFSSAETEAVNVNDFIKDSFLDGDVKRLDNQNKVENKDTSSITYNRTFSQQKSVNVVELNRLDT